MFITHWIAPSGNDVSALVVPQPNVNGLGERVGQRLVAKFGCMFDCITLKHRGQPSIAFLIDTDVVEVLCDEAHIEWISLPCADITFHKGVYGA